MPAGLIAIALSFLCAGNAGAAALGAYDGMPVLDVNVQGGGGDTSAIIDIERGYIFSTRDLTQIVKRLYALGRFSDVQVNATAVGQSISLTFVLIAQPRVSEVRFEGDKDDDVVTDLKGGVAPGEPLTDGLLDRLKKRCQRDFAQIGYEQAVCDVSSAGGGDKPAVVVRLQAGPPTRVSRIAFSGSVRAPQQELLAVLQLKPGRRFIDKKFKEDERALRLEFYNRQFLMALVRSEAAPDPTQPNALIITYTIEANDRVALAVTGNRVFKDDEIISLLHRASDERLFPNTLEDWKKRALELYFSHGYATARVELEHYFDSKAKIRHELLRVVEGPRIDVQKLSFPGATFFPDWRLRNEVFGTLDTLLDIPLITGHVDADATQALLDPHAGRRHSMPISGTHVTHPVWREDSSRFYDPAAYASACDNIRLIYLEQGFTEVKVGPAELVRPGGSVNAEAVIPIIEGSRTLVRSVKLPHVANYDDDEIFEISHVRPGEPYSDLQIEDTKNALQKALARRGYIYAQVSDEAVLSADHTAADVSFLIIPGDQVRVGRILIEGANTTKDDVIRQRLALHPLEPYSPDLALKTKDNLLGTNTLGGIQSPIEAFEGANVGLLEPDTPAERKDVIVRLIERQLNSLDFGAGLSTGQGLRGYIEYTQHNLGGSAWVLNLRLQLNRQLPFFINPLIYGGYADVVNDRYNDNFNTNLTNPATGRPYPLTGAQAAQNFLFDSIEHLLRGSVRSPRYLRFPGEPLFYVEASNERRNAIAYSLSATTLLGGIDVAIDPRMSFIYENAVNYNELDCYGTTSSGNDPTTQTTLANGQCPVFNGPQSQRVPTGHFVSGRFGPRFVLDLRPLAERANARHGFVAEIRADFVTGERLAAGGLANNQPYDFIRGEVKLHGYIPIGKRSSIMLAAMAGNIFVLNGRAGGDVIDILANERFYLGGPTTLRGMVDQSLIPQDACILQPPPPGQPATNTCANKFEAVQIAAPVGGTYTPPITAGGEFYVLYKGEFRFPLAGELYGVLFVDAGNLYYELKNFNPLALKVNPGVGLRFATGVGSVVLDWGFNVDPSAQLGENPLQFPYVSFGIY